MTTDKDRIESLMRQVKALEQENKELKQEIKELISAWRKDNITDASR